MNVSRALAAGRGSHCSRCGHSEFIHGDRLMHPCLFHRCDCSRFLLVLEEAGPKESGALLPLHGQAGDRTRREPARAAR